MNLKWPYTLLLILILVTGGAYAASPYLAMQKIADAVVILGSLDIVLGETDR